MNIALIAHDNKKELMAQFCTAYCGILAQHTLCATATTGQIISDATGLTIHRFLSFSHGGGQQIAARIAYNEIDMVLFFNDPRDEKSCESVSYISHRQHLSPVRPEQHPLCQQSGLGRDAGAGSGPWRSGLAQHRQSQNQALYRLTFPCISPTIDCVQTAMTEHE